MTQTEAQLRLEMAPPVSRWEKALRLAVVVLAGLNLTGLTVLMAMRAGYPFELEWIEGATVNSTQWILSGHFLYERPALTFIPLLYNPLYFYLSAALAALIGPGFLAPRLVSILAAIGCGLLLFAIVRLETKDWAAGVVAAGFYAATFHLAGAWMDVGRSDSLMVFFVLAAAFVARRSPGRAGALVCALMLACAYFSKQSALPFFLAFGGFYLLESRREWLFFWPALALLVPGVILLLDRLSQGWYSFYAWYVVRQTVLDAKRIRAFWTMDLLPNVPLALVAALMAVVLLGNPFRRSAAGSRSRFYLALTAGGLTASWWNRAAAGAYTNTLMSVLACLGLLLGLSLGLPKPPRGRRLWQSASVLVAAAQFLLLAYDPHLVLPTARDERAGHDLVTLIQSYPGDVFIPAHSYYAALAGKPTYAHWAAITDASGIWDTNLDVQHGGVQDPRRQIVLDEIQAAVARRQFSAIILDDIPREWVNYWRDVLTPYYRQEGRLFETPDVFWTVSGAPSRPQLIFVPK